MPNWFDEFVEDNLPVGGGGGDVTPPTDSASASFSSDYQVAKDQPITYSPVDAASALAYVKASVKLSDRTAEEVVYAGTGGAIGFVPPYSASSTIAGSGAAGVGYTLTIRRDGGWPKGVAIKLKGQAVDAKGNVLT